MIASLDALHKFPAEYPLPPPSLPRQLHLFFLEASHSANGPSRSIVARHTYTPLSRGYKISSWRFGLRSRCLRDSHSPCRKSALSKIEHPSRLSPKWCVGNETWRVGVRGIVAARNKGGGGLLYKCVGGAIRAVMCVVLCWVVAAKHSPLYSIIYRCIDSRRLRRNPRVGVPFGDKRMLIIGVDGDETKNAMLSGRGQDPSLWPVVDKQKGVKSEVVKSLMDQDQTKIPDSHRLYDV